MSSLRPRRFASARGPVLRPVSAFADMRLTRVASTTRKQNVIAWFLSAYHVVLAVKAVRCSLGWLLSTNAL